MAAGIELQKGARLFGVNDDTIIGVNVRFDSMSQPPSMAFSQSALNAGKFRQVIGLNRVIHIAAYLLGESVVGMQNDVRNVHPLQFLKKELEKIAGAKPHGR